MILNNNNNNNNNINWDHYLTCRLPPQVKTGFYLLGKALVHVLVLLDPEREHQPVLWPGQRRGALAAVLVLVRQASVEGEAVAVGGRVGRPKVAKGDFLNRGERLKIGILWH